MDGTPFGRYRLISLIGRGGMGEVWRAHDTDTDRIVAIKVLPVNFSENEEFQRRFRREALAAARLNTPHVVPIHNYGEIDSRLYVDMRLIDGRDLEAVLADGPIDPARAVRIIEGVASALHAAHEVGLLHRDVKPSNILLDRNDFAYLIDFGIARAADETRLTKSGNAIGTFQYIAPERLGTRAEEDARADIYSLACVLYECLTGHPPFAGDTMAGLVAAHLNTPPPRPSTTQPNVPAQIDQVIATGMAKDPDQRYQTTTELANAAHRALALAAGADTMHAETPPHAKQAATADTADRLFGNFAEFVRQTPPTKLVKPATPPRKLAKPATPPSKPAKPATRSPWLSGLRAILVGLAAFAAIIAAVHVLDRITGPGAHQSSSSSPNGETPTSTPSTLTSTPVSARVSTRTSTPTSTSRSVVSSSPSAAPQLDGLLLGPDQINTAMGATGMRVATTYTTMKDLNAQLSDTACLPLADPADAAVYAGSGWYVDAMRGEGLDEPSSSWTHLVYQNVVLFSSAHDADAFFTASAQSWPACANRQYTVTVAGKPDEVWTVGPVSNTNGTLSATKTQVLDNGWTCQRALTAAKDVAIDVEACTKSDTPLSGSALNIARQIAAKVPT